MAKSKYKPEIVQAIVEAIAATGRDADGQKAGAISVDTFYRWLKQYPEFSESIQRAKAEFRKTCPETLRAHALQRLGEYVRGEVIETWVKTSATKDAKGELVSTTRSVTEIRRGCPQWAIDRVLGKGLPILEAMQVLLNEGVASPQQAAVVESCLDEMTRQLRGLASLEAQQKNLENQYRCSED